MDPRLRLHNAVLGLAHPSPPWPTPLADAGFEIVRIEQPVTVAAAQGKVTVDLLFAARARDALLAVECKEGTVQEPQASRYQAMEPIDLVRTASITLDNPAAATLDVAYAVPDDWVDDTVRGLARSAPRAGTLVIDRWIRWQGPAPTDPQLAGAFAEPIAADLRAIPRLLLADDQSPPSSIAAELANELLAAVVQGRESVTVDALVERVFWGWARYGRAFQGRLHRAVVEMLREAAKQELSALIAVERPTAQSSATVVRLKAQPVDPSTQAGDVRANRAVRTKLNEFVARTTGRPVPPSPGQLDLLSELSVDEDVDDEELE